MVGGAPQIVGPRVCGWPGGQAVAAESSSACPRRSPAPSAAKLGVHRRLDPRRASTTGPSGVPVAVAMHSLRSPCDAARSTVSGLHELPERPYAEAPRALDRLVDERHPHAWGQLGQLDARRPAPSTPRDRCRHTAWACHTSSCFSPSVATFQRHRSLSNSSSSRSATQSHLILERRRAVRPADVEAQPHRAPCRLEPLRPTLLRIDAEDQLINGRHRVAGVTGELPWPGHRGEEAQPERRVGAPPFEGSHDVGVGVFELLERLVGRQLAAPSDPVGPPPRVDVAQGGELAGLGGPLDGDEARSVSSSRNHAEPAQRSTTERRFLSTRRSMTSPTSPCSLPSRAPTTPSAAAEGERSGGNRAQAAEHDPLLLVQRTVASAPIEAAIVCRRLETVRGPPVRTRNRSSSSAASCPTGILSAPGGGELDGERDAVEADAHVHDRGGVGGVEHEAGSGAPGTLHEQFDRVESFHLLDVAHLTRAPLSDGTRQTISPGTPSGPAARRHDGRRRSGGEQFADERRAVVHHVLAVVQHEQRRFVAERSDDLFHGGRARPPQVRGRWRGSPDRLAPSRCPGRDRTNQPHPTGELARHRRTEHDRRAVSCRRPGGADQRDQPF